MDLSAVADASARVSEICQRAASPWSFASVLSQVSQGASPDVVHPQVDTATTAPGGDGLTSYLFGQRLGSASAGSATGAMFGPASGLGSGTGRGAAPAGWADALPAAGRPWAGAIEAAATKAGVDPRLLAAITQAESGFNPGALSGAGAVGLTQLMPGTAAGLGVDPTDPVANLDGGARYLAGQLDSFGRVDLAVAAYNAGPGAVRQARGVPDYPETQAYVRRVLGCYQQLGGTL
ncbi:MAG: lytic transglycosylase domain-containing protein [Actinobacteria bacterium]|nr:MAG: lytic transglycosylase domain-containing protein [Actinomycetota bacterium]